MNDYAFLIYGLIELYETTFDILYLKKALELNTDMLKHFWDSSGSGLYLTADDSEELIVRTKEIYDGAMPSGNSIAMLNLLRLGRITGDNSLEEKAKNIGQAFSREVTQTPSGYAQLMVAVDFAIGPSCEIVIAGNSKAEDTKVMLNTVNKRFIPNKTVVLRPTEQKEPEIIHISGFTEGLKDMNGKATAYVCQRHSCNLPTNELQEMLNQIKA